MGHRGSQRTGSGVGVRGRAGGGRGEGSWRLPCGAAWSCCALQVSCCLVLFSALGWNMLSSYPSHSQTITLFYTRCLHGTLVARWTGGRRGHVHVWGKMELCMDRSHNKDKILAVTEKRRMRGQATVGKYVLYPPPHLPFFHKSSEISWRGLNAPGKCVMCRGGLFCLAPKDWVDPGAGGLAGRRKLRLKLSQGHNCSFPSGESNNHGGTWEFNDLNVYPGFSL